MISDENKTNIRMTLAVQLAGKSLDEIKEFYDWVVGPQSSIVKPEFNIVKS